MPYKDPEKRKEHDRIYRQKNRKKILKYQRDWHTNHPNYQKELRQKNIKQIRERDRLYYSKNKERENLRSRENWNRKKDEYNEKRRFQYKNDSEKRLKIKSQNHHYAKTHKKEISEYNKKYASEHRLEIQNYMKVYGKKWYQNNKKRVQATKKIYRVKNPQILLKSQLKYLKKLSIPFNLSAIQYKRALQSWSNLIKSRDKACVICGTTSQLNAHHIIHRAKIPELSFCVNNGILLCRIHHNEAHGNNLQMTKSLKH